MKLSLKIFLYLVILILFILNFIKTIVQGTSWFLMSLDFFLLQTTQLDTSINLFCLVFCTSVLVCSMFLQITQFVSTVFISSKIRQCYLWLDKRLTIRLFLVSLLHDCLMCLNVSLTFYQSLLCQDQFL